MSPLVHPDESIDPSSLTCELFYVLTGLDAFKRWKQVLDAHVDMYKEIAVLI